MHTNYTINIPEGLHNRVQELCQRYDVTFEHLVKSQLRNVCWYEKTYNRLPGNKSVKDTGELTEPEKPKGVVQRVIEAVKGTESD